MESINNFKGVLKYYSNVKEHLLGELSKAIGGVVKDILAGQDKIQYLELTAYTDYWNDGEPCEYYVHADNMYINGENSIYDYTTEVYWNGTVNPHYDVQVCELTKQVETFLIDEVGVDLFKEIFGDHVRVTLYANGVIEEEKYEDHD